MEKRIKKKIRQVKKNVGSFKTRKTIRNEKTSEANLSGNGNRCESGSVNSNINFGFIIALNTA